MKMFIVAVLSFLIIMGAALVTFNESTGRERGDYLKDVTLYSGGAEVRKWLTNNSTVYNTNGVLYFTDFFTGERVIVSRDFVVERHEDEL